MRGAVAERANRSKVVSIRELATQVPDGVRLGVGGVHLSRLPIRLIREVLALGRRDFTFTSWGGGLALELFLEKNAVRRLIFCFSSLDIFGLAPRFREALETGGVEVEEWTALAMMQGLHAAHFRLPEMPFQLPAGSDLMKQGAFWRETPAVFSDEPIGQARRLDIDVLLLHVQRADTAGNIEIQGARGFDLALLGAARKALVTAEEIVEPGVLGDAPRSFVLPREFVTAIAHEPFAAWPTSCLPYYSTDYESLLRYVEAEQQRRRGGTQEPASALIAAPSEDRRSFLATAASIRNRDLTPAVLQLNRVPATPGAYTTDELMVSCISREFDNSSICSVGSVSPLAMVSYLLAKRTHARDLTILSLNGGLIDIDAHPMSLTFAEALEFGTAKVFWGADESYHWYYQQGRITHEVITVAQIDKHGRTNNAWIGQGEKRLRLPGQGGMADVANLHRNFTLYLTRHSRERFVDSVEFCTASRGLLTREERERAGLQPGRVRLISDLAVFELDEEQRMFRLKSLHPGISLEELRDKSGGSFLVRGATPVTKEPDAQEIQLLREEIDPFGLRQLEFVPGRDRLALIGSILAAEAGLVQELAKRGNLAAKGEPK